MTGVLGVVLVVGIAGNAILIVIIALIHDLIVDSWKLSPPVVLAIPASAPGAGARIIQTINVSFDAEYRHWLFGRILGGLPLTSYKIKLDLDPRIVRCDMGYQQCPEASGGVNVPNPHISRTFVVQWDPGRGTFDLPIEIFWNQTLATTTKSQITVT